MNNLELSLWKAPSKCTSALCTHFKISRIPEEGNYLKALECNLMNMTRLDRELANLLDFNEKESIVLPNRTFKDMAERQKSLDKMRAGQASTPTIELHTTGLVPEGEGGNVVRFPGNRITRLASIILSNCLHNPAYSPHPKSVFFIPNVTCAQGSAFFIAVSSKH